MTRESQPPESTNVSDSTASTDLVAQKGHFFRNIRRDWLLYAMFLPALIGFFLFRYIPSIGALTIPFTRYSIVDGFFGSQWVGFKWFIQFVKSAFFPRLLRNTVLLGFYTLIFGFPAPIVLALLLNELRNQFFKLFSQSITYLPHFISTVIVVGMVYAFFGHDGYVNRVLVATGLSRLEFVNDPRWFRPLYVGSEVWQSMGWGSIIYLASLAGINPELYEAAFMDGANRFRRMIHVTLPGIAPTITILLILRVGSIINIGFERAFLMGNPGIYSVSDIFATYVYRRGIQGLDYAYASAVGLINAVVGLVLLITANYISRLVSDNSLW